MTTTATVTTTATTEHGEHTMTSNPPKPFRSSVAVGIAAAVAIAWAPAGEARVTRIVIDTTTVIAGQPYEELTGRAFGELDPHGRHNELITDIRLAPRNAKGKVEY